MIRRGLNQDLRNIQADINESGSYSDFINVYDIQDVYSKGIHTITIRGSEELKMGTYIYVEIVDESGRPIPIQVVPSSGSYEEEFLPLRRFSFEILDETPNGVCSITFIATLQDDRVLKYQRKFSINKSLPSKPIMFRGDWTEGEFYESNDVVFVGTDSYICILSHEARQDNKPPDIIYWRSFAGTGDKGEKGDAGQPAKLINIRKLDGNIFKFLQDGTVTPEFITLDVVKQNTEQPIDWYIGEGANKELIQEGSDEVIISKDLVTSDQARLTIRAITQDGELEDRETIYTLVEGSEAITVTGRNTNYAFPATSNGVVDDDSYEDGSGFIRVYYGIQRIPFNSTAQNFNEVGDFEFFISDAGVNENFITVKDIVNDTEHPEDAKILLEGFDAGARSAGISFTVGVKNGQDQRSFEKNFNYTKAYDVDIVQSITIDAESQIFVRDDNFEITPNSINVSAILRNLEVSDNEIIWGKSDGSGGFNNFKTGEHIEILPSDLDGDYTTFEVSVNSEGNTFTDRLSFAIVDEGADSFTALLDNEFHGVPTDASGNIIGDGLENATSKITIFKGATDVTENFNIEVTSDSGVFNRPTSDSLQVLTLTDDVGIFTFNATPKSNEDTGDEEETKYEETYPSQIIKNFTVVKVRQGITGRIGLSLNYRGEFTTDEVYKSTQISTDVVLYNGTYYYITPDDNPNTDGNDNLDGNGDPILPSNNFPWVEFDEQFESVATDILLAKDATVRRTLTIGSSADVDQSGDGISGIVRSLGSYEVDENTGEITSQVTYNQDDMVIDYNSWYADKENYTRKYIPFFEMTPERGVEAWRGSFGGWEMEQNVLQSVNDKSGIILDSKERIIKLVGNLSDSQHDVVRISPNEVSPSVAYETGDENVNYDSRGISRVSLDFEVSQDSSETTPLSVGNNKSYYITFNHDNPSNINWGSGDNVRQVKIQVQKRVSSSSWDTVKEIIYDSANNPDITSSQFIGNTSNNDELRLLLSIQADSAQQQADEDDFSSASFGLTDIKFYISNVTISLRTDGLFQRDARGIELPLSEVSEGFGNQVISGVTSWSDLSVKPFDSIGDNLRVNNNELTTDLSDLSTGTGLSGTSYDGSTNRSFSIDEDIVPRLDRSNVFQESITAPEGNFETLSLDELEVGVSGQKTGIIYFQSDDTGLPRLRMRGFSMDHNPSIYTETGGNETLEIDNLGGGRLDVEIGGNISANNLSIANWDSAYDRSVTGLLFSNGVLSIERENVNNVTENLDGRYLLLTGGTIDGSLTINEDLTVLGTEFIANVETVEIEDNLGIINSGESGAGITAGFAGWKVDRGTESNFLFGYQESNSAFSVGKDGTILQAIATREDDPLNEGVMYWSDSESRLKTSSNLTFNGDNLILGNQASQTQHAVRADRTLVAGDGLTGLGDLTSNRIVNLGTPSVIEVDGSNSTTEGSHTHSLDLSGRVLTAGNGLTGLGHLGEDRIVNMGIPTTIVVDGNNETYSESHRHALDLSGRSLTIIGDDVLTLQNNTQHLGNDIEWALSILSHDENQRGVLDHTFQEIYGDKQFNDRLLIDEEIRSTNYASQLTGFQLTKEGNADLRQLISDEIITKSFISDTTLSLAGSQYLTKSMAVNLETIEFFGDDELALRMEDGSVLLMEDGTQVDKEGYHYTITVEPHSGLGGLSSGLVFEEGDFVKFRAKDSDDGIRIQNIWATIKYPIEGDESSVFQSDNSQKYRIVLENPLEDDVISFKGGSVILDYGTEGDAIIESTVLGDNAPFTRMYRWYDKPWKNNQYEILTTTGNLASVGKGTPSDPEFGSFLRDSLYVEFSDGTSKFGKNADGEGNDGLYFDENNYWLLNKGFRSSIVSDLDTTVSELSTSVEFLEVSAGNIVFRQDTEPTYRAFDSENNEIPLEDGDIWIRTESGDHEGKVYIWNDEGEGNWEITESAFRSGFAGLKNTVETDRDKITARSVLQVNADGKLASVDVYADSEEGSEITILADKFDLQANNIHLESTENGYFKVGGSEEYVEWDGSNVNIKGQLNITSSDVDGLGDLATQNRDNLDYEDGADPTENNQAKDIVNLPETVNGTGFYATGTELGFYQDNDWSIYFNNNNGVGQFFINGDSNNGLAWDGSVLQLDATEFDLNANNIRIDSKGENENGYFKIGNTSKYIEFDGIDLTGVFGNIDFTSDEFNLDANNIHIESTTNGYFRIGDTSKYIEFDGSDLTGQFGDIDFSSNSFSLTAGSMEIDSNDGISIDAYNYFKQDKTFSFGGGTIKGTGTSASIDVSDFNLTATSSDNSIINLGNDNIILSGDGSGQLAGGNISWDDEGTSEFTGKVTAEAFTLGDINGDKWLSTGEFQFGGSDGIIYSGSGSINFGSNINVSGDITILDGNGSINVGDFLKIDPSGLPQSSNFIGDTNYSDSNSMNSGSTINVPFSIDSGGFTTVIINGNVSIDTAIFGEDPPEYGVIVRIQLDDNGNWVDAIEPTHLKGLDQEEFDGGVVINTVDYDGLRLRLERTGTPDAITISYDMNVREEKSYLTINQHGIFTNLNGVKRSLQPALFNAIDSSGGTGGGVNEDGDYTWTGTHDFDSATVNGISASDVGLGSSANVDFRSLSLDQTSSDGDIFSFRGRDSNGDTTNTAVLTSGTNAVGSSAGRYDLALLVNTGATPRDFWIEASSGSIRLNVSHNVRASDFVLSSDRRLKDEIEDLYSIDLVRNLKPKSYIKKERREYGFIAQDIQKILPEMVDTSAKYLHLHRNDIIALNTSAIQYLDKEFIQQKSEMDILKEKVQKLEKQVVKLGGEV